LARLGSLTRPARRAQELGYDVLRARGSELEVDFALGVVRQLFERRLAGVLRTKKVLNVQWEQNGELKIISFKHGDWETQLLL